MNKIHAFALKWLEKFNDPNINYLELVDHYLADECHDLGFEVDSCHEFFEKFGLAFCNAAELEKIIDKVDDIPSLGSAIFFQWRYFNHWAYSGAEILEPQNRAWFVTALTRLEMLSRG